MSASWKIAEIIKEHKTDIGLEKSISAIPELKKSIIILILVMYLVLKKLSLLY